MNRETLRKAETGNKKGTQKEELRERERLCSVHERERKDKERERKNI